MQLHPWVTENGANPLPLEEEHCTVVEVTEEEVQNSIKLIPSLSTVVSRTHLIDHAKTTVPAAGTVVFAKKKKKVMYCVAVIWMC